MDNSSFFLLNIYHAERSSSTCTHMSAFLLRFTLNCARARLESKIIFEFKIQNRICDVRIALSLLNVRTNNMYHQQGLELILFSFQYISIDSQIISISTSGDITSRTMHISYFAYFVSFKMHSVQMCMQYQVDCNNERTQGHWIPSHFLFFLVFIEFFSIMIIYFNDFLLFMNCKWNFQYRCCW